LVSPPSTGERSCGWWPWAAAAVTLLVWFTVEQSVAGRVGPALDDGWIYFAFARSFLEGDPFSYPGGDGPVGAITSPLWCGLLALTFAVGGATPMSGRVLGVIAFLACVMAVLRLARAIGGDRRLAVLAGVIVALTPRVAWSSMSGMENGLGTALACFGIALHQERREQSERRYVPALVVLALAGWARPENFVFLGLAVLHRRKLASIAVGVALIATFPAYHLWIYGVPLPLPFYAKRVPGAPLEVLSNEGLVAGLVAGAKSSLLQVASGLALLVGMLPPLAIGLRGAFSRGSSTDVRFLVAAIGAFLAARGLLGHVTPLFQQGRYFVQLWPMFVLVCLVGIRRVGMPMRSLVLLGAAAVAFAVCEPRMAAAFAFDHLTPTGPLALDSASRWTIALPVAAAVVASIAAGRVTRPTYRVGAAFAFSWLLIASGLGAVRHGVGVRDTQAMNVVMAENVARTTQPADVVACHDLGALGWFARRPLIDLAGLGTAEIARAPRDAGGNVDVIGFLERRRPRWLCLTDDMLAKLNPTTRMPKGLTGWTEIEAARVEFPQNVTVLGSVYRLIRLDWER
jgi:hypothetical protein